MKMRAGEKEEYMNRVKDIVLMRGLYLLDVLLLAVPLKIALAMYYAVVRTGGNTIQTDILQLVLFSVFFYRFAAVYDGFEVSTSRISDLVLGQMLAVLVSDALMFIVEWVMLGSFPNVWPMLPVIAAQGAVIVIWSFVVHKWYFETHPPLQALLVYCSGRSGIDSLQKEYSFQKRFVTSKIISIKELMAEDYSSLNEAKSVFFETHGGEGQYELMKRCTLLGKTVFVLPEAGEYILHSAKSIHMMHRSLLRIRVYNPSLSYTVIKRAMDIVFSAAALIVLSPLMVITAIAIKVCDGGPVFYRQNRLTQGGRVFSILKFRSMRVDAEKDGVARLAGENDDRITPVGHFIRAVRFDELPQLLNILKGDMSIVGPRPERPELTEEYAAAFPDFKLRLNVKAGLTGYAQVHGKYNTPPKEKLIMDMAYIENPSILNDLEIMFATVKILLTKEATEGVEEGQTNALREESVQK